MSNRVAERAVAAGRIAAAREGMDREEESRQRDGESWILDCVIGVGVFFVGYVILFCS